MSSRLSGLGSTIYQTAWKQHVTPLGRTISRQRASAPRTSASEPSSAQSPMNGWPTATARDGFPAHSEEYIAAKKAQGHGMANLNDVVMLSGWPTTQASDGSGGGQMKRALNPARSNDLMDFALLAGWSTASARDWKDTAGMAIEATNPDGTTRTRLDQLPRQAQMAGWPTAAASDGIGGKGPRQGVSMSGRMPDGSKVTMDLSASVKLAMDHEGPVRFTASGQILTGCSAEMESGGQLNPAFSGWLMGYPREWDICGWNAQEKTKMARKADPTPVKFCKTCGTQMERQRFNGRLEDKSAFARRTYCDQDCMAQDYEGTIKVMNDKNSRRQSAKTRKPDCEICGSSAHHVHHRDENPQNNDPLNLQSLCASCHKKEHLQKPAIRLPLGSSTEQPFSGATAMQSIRTRRPSSSKASRKRPTASAQTPLSPLQWLVTQCLSQTSSGSAA